VAQHGDGVAAFHQFPGDLAGGAVVGFYFELIFVELEETFVQRGFLDYAGFQLSRCHIGSGVGG